MSSGQGSNQGSDQGSGQGSDQSSDQVQLRVLYRVWPESELGFRSGIAPAWVENIGRIALLQNDLGVCRIEAGTGPPVFESRYSNGNNTQRS